MLALAAMVRSPSRLDPRRNPKLLRDAMQRLAKNIGYEEKFEPFDLAARKAKNINISGAIRYIRDTHHANSNKINSTIDYSMQEFASNLLEQRLQKLKPQNAHHAAMLVVNHQTGQILAWVNAAVKEEGSAYDSVTVPRQPGSAMKPFVYAMALEKNWQAATQILDAPLSSAIGAGQHQYRNYSGKYYGLITMRQALGNSLNIPAVKAVQYVGLENYMQRLMNLGFTTLQHSADIYGDGIALGNAEVTLLELVQAYTVFPNNGRLRKLRIIQDIENAVDQVFSPEISYVISNILSDRNARGLEFGAHSVLNMPGQVAVKTGTSTDYRDAWTIAYNDRYIVGVWIGNLDQEPMDGVTGSTGPALVARSMMHELSKRSPAYIFNRPKSLQNASICKEPYRIKQYDEDCNSIDDIFIGNPTNAVLTYKTNLRADNWWIAHPTEGLKFAMDPRIPDELEMINFRIGGNIADNTKIIWQVNDQTYTSQNSSFKWPMQKGQFDLTATIDGVSYKRSFEVR